MGLAHPPRKRRRTAPAADVEHHARGAGRAGSHRRVCPAVRTGWRLTRQRRRTPEDVAAKRELRAQLTDPAPVMEAAAAFLAVRPRSEAETRRRLLKLGYPDVLVDDVLTRLVEMGY